mgnify:CR=1 FL=1
MGGGAEADVGARRGVIGAVDGREVGGGGMIGGRRRRYGE